MLGCYKNTMAIFVLKNGCKWADKPAEEEGDCNEKIAESIGRLAEVIAMPAQSRKVEDFE